MLWLNKYFHLLNFYKFPLSKRLWWARVALEMVWVLWSWLKDPYCGASIRARMWFSISWIIVFLPMNEGMLHVLSVYICEHPSLLMVWVTPKSWVMFFWVSLSRLCANKKVSLSWLFLGVLWKQSKSAVHKVGEVNMFFCLHFLEDFFTDRKLIFSWL